MTAPIATRVVTDPHTGKTIAGPAHLFAPPRITASDVARYGSFDAAKREIWGVVCR